MGRVVFPHSPCQSFQLTYSLFYLIDEPSRRLRDVLLNNEQHCVLTNVGYKMYALSKATANFPVQYIISPPTREIMAQRQDIIKPTYHSDDGVDLR
jgi:hypothetical protein